MSAYQVQADPTAVMGKRIVAFIIDMVLVWAIFFGVAAATASTETLTGEVARSAFGDENLCNLVTFDGVASDSSSTESNFQVCSATITLPSGEEYGTRLIYFDGEDNLLIDNQTVWPAYAVGVLYGILVFWIWQGLSGMTPGKALLGVRTVNEQGVAPGIGRAIIRSLLMIVDGFCCYIVGLVSALSSKGHRRVGDMAAKTFVVGKGSIGQPVTVDGLTPPGAYGAAPAADPYGQPQQAAWPTAAPGIAPTAPAATPPAAGGEPQWDEARQAYIQWDPAQNAWLQFDQATQQWNRI